MNTLHFQKMSGAYTPLAGPVLRITPALAQSSQIQIAPDRATCWVQRYCFLRNITKDILYFV